MGHHIAGPIHSLYPWHHSYFVSLFPSVFKHWGQRKLANMDWLTFCPLCLLGGLFNACSRVGVLLWTQTCNTKISTLDAHSHESIHKSWLQTFLSLIFPPFSSQAICHLWIYIDFNRGLFSFCQKRNISCTTWSSDYWDDFHRLMSLKVTMERAIGKSQPIFSLYAHT